MGECAEICARHYGISREQQDQHAITSHQRAQAATASGAFLREIVPVEVAGPRGRPPVVVSTDEGPSKMDADKLQRLKPYFAKVWGQAVALPCGALCCHLVAQRCTSS
jgi:acetyl-CoA C-acetyltransferase